MTVAREKEFLNVTISGLEHVSNWDDGESSFPLMDHTSSSLNSSDHSSSYANSLIPQPLPATKKKSAKEQSNQPFMEYEWKNARDALVGSTSAVINFLSSSGVPKPACDQLQKNLEMGRYFAVLKRVQDYIQCLSSVDESAILAKIHLSVIAWEALCRFKSIEYKRAYKRCFNLRYECRGSSQEIQAAIALQVQIAEQCTTCQKKLYLVRRWQRNILNKMKRTTMIAPEGYQPIRCL